MAKPTISQKDIVSSRSFTSNAKREVQFTTLNTSNTGAFNRVIFRAPSTKARITYVGVTNHVAMYKEGNATWIFNAKNVSTAATLNAQAASMSDQTLTATGFKEIPVNNGNSTLLAGASLRLEMTVTGVPQTLSNASVQVEWEPING